MRSHAGILFTDRRANNVSGIVSSRPVWADTLPLHGIGLRSVVHWGWSHASRNVRPRGGGIPFHSLAFHSWSWIASSRSRQKPSIHHSGRRGCVSGTTKTCVSHAVRSGQQLCPESFLAQVGVSLSGPAGQPYNRYHCTHTTDHYEELTTCTYNRYNCTTA